MGLWCRSARVFQERTPTGAWSEGARIWEAGGGVEGAGGEAEESEEDEQLEEEERELCVEVWGRDGVWDWLLC